MSDWADSVQVLPKPTPASSQEIIDYLRYLLKIAHKHEIEWLDINGQFHRANGFNYLDYSFPPID